jgi:hypothetical protein
MGLTCRFALIRREKREKMKNRGFGTVSLFEEVKVNADAPRY